MPLTAQNMSQQKNKNVDKLNPKVVEVKKENKQVTCNFCNKSEIDALTWGPMYKLEDITVHYFCLLFSAGLSQNGEDEEGILGFMPKDIRKELKRGLKLKCKYCKTSRATVGCSVKICKVSFHYPCGYANGSLFQFIGNYESYCLAHRKNDLVIDAPRNIWECPICTEPFDDTEKYPIKPPCCKTDKNSSLVFHRQCMMQSALSAGMHFFKCPLCSDKEIFCDAMRMAGIFVPDRDASWELEPNAFEELNQQYNRCDAQPCLCPQGRRFGADENEDQNWKIVRCGGCGASATHMKCSFLKNLTFRCVGCANILAGQLQDDSDDEDLPLRSRISRHTFGSESDDEFDESYQDVSETLANRAIIEEEEEKSSSSEAELSDSTKVNNEENAAVQIQVIGTQRYKVVGVEKKHDEFDVDVEESEDSDSEDDDFPIRPSSQNTISEHLDLNEKESQVRTGLVESAETSKSVLNYLTNLDNINAGPSNRVLRSQLEEKSPKIKENIGENFVAKKSIDKIVNLFQEKLLNIPFVPLIKINNTTNSTDVNANVPTLVVQESSKLYAKRKQIVPENISSRIEVNANQSIPNKKIPPPPVTIIAKEKDPIIADAECSSSPGTYSSKSPSIPSAPAPENEISLIVLSDSDDEVEQIGESKLSNNKTKPSIPEVIDIENEIKTKDKKTPEAPLKPSASNCQVSDSYKLILKRSPNKKRQQNNNLKYFNGQTTTGTLIASSFALSRNRFGLKREPKTGPETEIIFLDSDDDDEDNVPNNLPSTSSSLNKDLSSQTTTGTTFKYFIQNSEMKIPHDYWYNHYQLIKSSLGQMVNKSYYVLLSPGEKVLPLPNRIQNDRIKRERTTGLADVGDAHSKRAKKDT